MFGNKLRSWMEAVRPKKKQQRKEKLLKSCITHSDSGEMKNGQVSSSCQASQNHETTDGKLTRTLNGVQQQQTSHVPRYSGANLSSPESAYSTGYSTDGTSPGAPPEYYINIRTGGGESERRLGLSTKHISHASPCRKENSPHFLTLSRSKTSSHANLSTSLQERERLSTVAVRYDGDRTSVSMIQDYDNCRNGASSLASVTLHGSINPANGVTSRLTEVVVNSSVTSPRQRNRIRTNPWVPGSNLSPGNSSTGLHTRQDQIPKSPLINSPVSLRYASPSALRSPANRSNRCKSLSSSSCSSLSVTSLHWDATVVCRSPRNNSVSDEDCTLNEMMGKYDESYIYEKETDILSDSDPTDCETDIDTGQDGGDEDDPCEFDFIDNGSYSEYNVDGKEGRNTGHCTYYNFDVQRKSSRRKMMRRSYKQDNVVVVQSERRRQSSSSKKRRKQPDMLPKISSKQMQVDGSRSAGATPLSVRRTNLPVSKLAVEDRLKRRSNSVSFSKSPISTFDKRDKEADKKYKELIVEAEHILMSMKTNGLSPRRIPGPPNKRVEILRNTECPVKPDAFVKNRLIEDTDNLQLSKLPSTNFNSPRFSPKKNHITNFINCNSPVLIRKDVETRTSPLAIRKEQDLICTKSSNNSPLLPRNKHLRKRSPKHKKKLNKISMNQENDGSSSSDGEMKCGQLARNPHDGFCCPQSEPVKRKAYNKRCKAVAFNLDHDNGYNKENPVDIPARVVWNDSTENLRQQVLLNTIANLKRSLEDQSASLKQVYKSSHNLQL